jgi:hypothetical protein
MIRRRPRATSSILRASAVLGVLAALAPACSSDPDSSFLQAVDLQQAEGVELAFDRNSIVDSAQFTDIDGLDVSAIDAFFIRNKSPYKRSSFLATYQSNGVRAADAIMRASRTYHINPLAFLVYAQAAEGLVSATEYPFPPSRVEYVFRCGCLQEDDCLPDLAGFDRQVDCLGRQLRVALDEIAANGLTASNWGPDHTSLTLDGRKVTPIDDATAAIYDHLPVVAEGKGGGSWLFWNVWNLYAVAIDYFGPLGGEVGSGGIGDGCTSDAQCGFEGGTCAANYPDGMCTLACNGSCPTNPDAVEGFCVDFQENGGFCLPVCNPGASACRPGYKCQRLARFGGGGGDDSQYVCFPDAAQP